MMLVISVLLALVPLLGIAWIVLYGSVTTVDGLFMSLILAAMSGIVGLNILIELRKRGSGKQSSATATSTASGGLRQRGKVESVQFYESGVGQPNKSVVTLSDGGRVEPAGARGRHAECLARRPEGSSHVPQGKRTQRAGGCRLPLRVPAGSRHHVDYEGNPGEANFPAPRCLAQLRYKF